MEKTVRKVTFEEAERLDFEFWLTKSPVEKWAVLSQIREAFIGPDKRLKKIITKVKHDW